MCLMIRNIFSVVALLAGMMCSSGCLHMMFPFTSRSLGSTGNKNELPFYDLQDSADTLKRPINVVYYPEIANQPDSAKFLIDGVVIPPNDRNKYPKQLPAGTPICFDYRSFRITKYYYFFFFPCKIRYEVSFYLKGRSPDETYTYTWGKGLYLHRAPCEDEETPEKRYVGFNGKSYRPDKERNK